MEDFSLLMNQSHLEVINLKKYLKEHLINESHTAKFTALKDRLEEDEKTSKETDKLVYELPKFVT